MLKQLEETPLSGDEIREIVGPEARIVGYNELRQFGSLRDLLGSDGAVILYRTTPNYGHWVTCFMGPKERAVTYFDSYGMNVDDILTEQSDEERHALGQYTPYLSQMLVRALNNGEIDEVDINWKHLQSDSPKMADCGRYAALRLLLNNLDNDQFNSIITKRAISQGEKGAGSVADKNVTLLTS